MIPIVADPDPPEIVAGENLTVTPLGAPEEDSVMVESNPPEGVAVTLSVALPPGATVTDVLDRLRLKLPCVLVVTVRVTVVDLIVLPEVPFMVMM